NELPAGVYLVGRAAGTQHVPSQMTEGRLAGENAAAFLGHGAPAGGPALVALAAQKEAEPQRTSQRVTTAPPQVRVVPGHQKRIVCYCEDVTEKDIQNSIAEGFD